MAEKTLTDEQIKLREDVLKEFEGLCKSRGLQIKPDIDFPKYRELPVEGALALQVIQNLGGRIVISLVDLPPEEKPAEEKKPE